MMRETGQRGMHHLTLGAFILLVLVLGVVLYSGKSSLRTRTSSSSDADASSSSGISSSSSSVSSSETTSTGYGKMYGDSVYEDEDGETKPSIIFVLADDLGWNSLGYAKGIDGESYDFADYTPTLTKLAGKGVIMNNYYAQEVCTPSRASLLTGRYPLSIGMQYGVVEPQQTNGMSLYETTIAEVLRDAGYKTHMLGKWHLGHHSARHLPTARGFDSYVGFLSGESYYWSKKYPKRAKFVDFMNATTDCYAGYDGADRHDYSTFMYRDLAISIIEEHDESTPLFIYLSFQAVHNPFNDVDDRHKAGVPKEYLKDGLYDDIVENVKGRNRRQVAMSLALMDDAVDDIYDSLDDKGILENTYIIFASDNGGCYSAGGRNGPLRGTKGTLFEGGVKVDAFIYSKLFEGTDVKGTEYDGLFHVSDWFPTILSLANVEYTADEGYDLDGFDQVSAWETGTSPREFVLYNAYDSVDGKNYDMWNNGTFAIRDSQYKLMHSFNAPTYSYWYDTKTTVENDDLLDNAECSQDDTFTGDFTAFLFDLTNDPYETVNLYSQSDPTTTAIKKTLYEALDVYKDNARTQYFDNTNNLKAVNEWRKHGDIITPWVKSEDLSSVPIDKTYPEFCGVERTARPSGIPTQMPSWSPDHSRAPTAKPTKTPKPSKSPTKSPSGTDDGYPTHKPTKSPTHEPTYEPTRVDEETDEDAQSHTAPPASTEESERRRR